MVDQTKQLPEYFRLSPYYVDNIDTPGFDWERFQDKIDSISENLYGVLTDEASLNFIKSGLQRYGLSFVQGQEIARIIRDVVIGDIFIGDMPAELAGRLGVDQNTAREMANLIISQLFQPVLEEIKKVQTAKFPERVAQRQMTPAPTGLPAQTGGQPRPIPGADLPETGGNIIDLRNQR